ncbi:hypothetical protein [Mucilaginibacter sp. CSA2-8R]|uniref:hypothetical protein n=1 Tax=Mucilaginibacter sp. CSA2-8R TaxID=3141542 RepID=UPI00315C95AE
MRLTHFLRLSLDYPRTHQLLLRLLLDDSRFASLLTGLPDECHYTVRLEAEGGLYDLGLYHNGLAVGYLQNGAHDFCVLSADTNTSRRWAYEDLIPLLNCYLEIGNTLLAHPTSVLLAQHYRDALQQKYHLAKIPVYG